MGRVSWFWLYRLKILSVRKTLQRLLRTIARLVMMPERVFVCSPIRAVDAAAIPQMNLPMQIIGTSKAAQTMIQPVKLITWAKISPFLRPMPSITFPEISSYIFSYHQRLSGLGVWFALRVREVQGSNPDWAQTSNWINFFDKKRCQVGSN